MSSHRLSRFNFDDFEVLGYSIAGEETVVAVPTLDVCFDIGKAPDQLLPINHVLLTHGHMDHAAGIAYYCSQRDFREMSAGTVLLPASLALPLERLLDCWGRFDGSRPPANIVPMAHGREYELRRNLFAFAFSTNHGADSLGYTIIERRQKLKPEYTELSGPEIAALRKQGQNVTYTLNLPLVTYLGDTAAGPFEQLACLRHSKVLIAECTFFEQDHHARARAGRHYHFDQLAEFLESLECEHIILTHLSRRTDIGLARKMVDDRLSPELARRVHFLMERPGRPFRKPDSAE